MCTGLVSQFSMVNSYFQELDIKSTFFTLAWHRKRGAQAVVAWQHVHKQGSRDVAEEAAGTKVVGAETDATHKMKEKRSEQIRTSTVYLQHCHLVYLECLRKKVCPNISCTIKGNCRSVASIRRRHINACHMSVVQCRRRQKCFRVLFVGMEKYGQREMRSCSRQMRCRCLGQNGLESWMRCVLGTEPLQCCRCAEELD